VGKRRETHVAQALLAPPLLRPLEGRVGKRRETHVAQALLAPPPLRGRSAARQRGREGGRARSAPNRSLASAAPAATPHPPEACGLGRPHPQGGRGKSHSLVMATYMRSRAASSLRQPRGRCQCRSADNRGRSSFSLPPRRSLAPPASLRRAATRGLRRRSVDRALHITPHLVDGIVLRAFGKGRACLRSTIDSTAPALARLEPAWHILAACRTATPSTR
jgi:hypothetical protein